MSQPPASAAIAGDVTRGSGAGGRDQKAARVAAAGEVSFEELSAVMLHRDEMESVMHYYYHDCRLLVIVFVAVSLLQLSMYVAGATCENDNCGNQMKSVRRPQIPSAPSPRSRTQPPGGAGRAGEAGGRGGGALRHLRRQEEPRGRTPAHASRTLPHTRAHTSPFLPWQ